MVVVAGGTGNGAQRIGLGLPLANNAWRIAKILIWRVLVNEKILALDMVKGKQQNQEWLGL